MFEQLVFHVMTISKIHNEHILSDINHLNNNDNNFSMILVPFHFQPINSTFLRLMIWQASGSLTRPFNNFYLLRTAMLRWACLKKDCLILAFHLSPEV